MSHCTVAHNRHENNFCFYWLWSLVASICPSLPPSVCPFGWAFIRGFQLWDCWRTDRQTDGWTDRRYQADYLPASLSYRVDKNCAHRNIETVPCRHGMTFEPYLNQCYLFSAEPIQKESRTNTEQILSPQIQTNSERFLNQSLTDSFGHRSVMVHILLWFTYVRTHPFIFWFSRTNPESKIPAGYYMLGKEFHDQFRTNYNILLDQLIV